MRRNLRINIDGVATSLSGSDAYRGPPAERKSWWSLNPRRDASPCVLKRKVGFLTTRLQRLEADTYTMLHITGADKTFFLRRWENTKAWARHSAQILLDAAVYGKARVSPDSVSGKVLREMVTTRFHCRPRRADSVREICEAMQGLALEVIVVLDALTSPDLLEVAKINALTFRVFSHYVPKYSLGRGAPSALRDL